MEIVVTHRNADFDALASQVAAAKLYPGAVMVRTRQVSPSVRDFLALHKEHFELVPSNEVDQDAVTRLIVVDVRRASRLRDFDRLVERCAANDPTLDVSVYDHHAESADDIVANNGRVEPIGATTTMLVEMLLERGIQISAVEATLFALGIYSDTGAFTFPITTKRDISAAATLVGRGASLATIRFFLHPPLASMQRDAMLRLLDCTCEVDFGGVHVGVGVVELDRRINGLADVAEQVLAIDRFEAIFAIFVIGAHATIIARSQVPYIDVGDAMHALGGGGHPGAGSVLLKNTSADEARRLVLEYCDAHPFRPRLVRHMMSTPVHTVQPEQVLEQVHRYFRAQGISGAPVVRDGELIGVISKRDIRAAERDGRANLPVSSCMASHVKSTTPDEPLLRAFERMVQGDVGRLPVIENGHIVGIITRSDALRLLYPDQAK